MDPPADDWIFGVILADVGRGRAVALLTVNSLELPLVFVSSLVIVGVSSVVELDRTAELRDVRFSRWDSYDDSHVV